MVGGGGEGLGFVEFAGRIVYVGLAGFRGVIGLMGSTGFYIHSRDS